MNKSQKGEFYGQTNKTIHIDGIILTDTEYTHERVDWHYHENAYFTFILEGNVIEGNKKEVYNCSAGSLLFHNWQEPHYNIKPAGFTRGFHIEIDHSWFDNLEFDSSILSGSINIGRPDIKLLLYKIFIESKVEDNLTTLSIQELLIKTMGDLGTSIHAKFPKNPAWVSQIEAILRDSYTKCHSLKDLSKTLNIHPVHLSRDFSKYFHTGIGEYIRKLRVEKSLQLIAQKKSDLTTIAYECGFADQSHFTRSFKEINNITPSRYRHLLFG